MNLTPANKRRSWIFTLTAAALLAATTVRAEDPPKKGWESVAAVGVTLTRGNSENFLATGSIDSVRKWSVDELRLGGSAGYGETRDRSPGGTGATSVNTDFVKGYEQWNHLFTERFYCGFRVSIDHDTIAALDYRLTGSPLVGYYFIKHTNTFLSGEVGPSGVWERQGGVTKTYVAARVAQRFEHKFKTGAKLWESVEWVDQINDVQNWILNAEFGISAPISKSLDIRLLVQDSYDNRPAPGHTENDVKLIGGIGYRF